MICGEYKYINGIRLLFVFRTYKNRSYQREKRKNHKGYGGGILIRGLRKEEANKTLNGPKNCYNELYEVYEDAFSPSAPYIVASNHIEYSVKSDKRYNLNDRNNRLWRFHVVNK
ncbi:hypothetical protein PRLR5107_31270 [Prevotella lacticifex]|uniref:Uncharacterized protein n=1 Tax=Prevotella lacticifex TaxID=2854755 RepID=A0A9R1C812_9BACT|nr:hypothetical protein PRLR5003_30140 [Prevotella lacticifex]GJG40798.1 hypothetical protein PRLR5019_27690 [Prevotella lacticifex]GJG43731.1 hypothetical protein PRLR5025_25170 [Prevotella lacticifex]GJG47512.1 hypothetical protein PRLR5027_31070 [Prevotella lacticifex]GJG49836.1 hypothetical protein PRLR5052_22490 [Prevotella lacticifex]